MFVKVGYTDTDFYCPMCGLEGMLKRRVNAVSILYCPECRREFMVILDPLIEGEPNETRH
jgi:Zn-finger nucleic acid-binding protein